MQKKDPLGKGLSAILRDVEEKGAVTRIPVSRITVNPEQPRLELKRESLNELASSIKEKGLLQPILVRRKGDGYEIIAGERRFKASCMAGLPEVPAIVKEADDKEALELALIENLQREDLNAIEVAKVYERFVGTFGYTHEELGRKLGIDRSSVSNAIRLLKLPEWIRQMIQSGKLSQGHGRVLITLKDPAEQKRYVNRVLREGVSVRELERTRRSRKSSPSPFDAVEEVLRGALKTKVHITFKGKRGRVIIEFYSKDDLERLVEALSPPE